ncbi:Fatty acid amide hydrolase [Capsicum annuum]|nr:Fatty acid amide hydrolase [Capsicum annuum]
MGTKKVKLPANEVDMAAANYTPQRVQGPHLTGFWLKLFVMLIEAPIIGSMFFMNKNRVTEMLKNTVIPETPMFVPEFPPQEPESDVFCLEEDGKPEERIELAMQCLPDYNPDSIWITDPSAPFRYWKIRDYACAYKSKLTTPSQARSELSILDGIFIAVKDDIDCYPYPSKGGTTWFHELREVKKDAVCVSRLRSCSAVLVGKTNMHKLAIGTTGNNENFGTTRNPHDPDRYTGGSSSGSAAIVASGLCSAALGTDGGGSVRIPSSLCGVVGLKTTYGRTEMNGNIIFFENQYFSPTHVESSPASLLLPTFEDLLSSSKRFKPEFVYERRRPTLPPPDIDLPPETATQLESENSSTPAPLEPTRRSTRVSRPPNWYCFSSTFSTISVPTCYSQASEHECWQKAMEEELLALKENDTWDIVSCPSNIHPIGCKWVYSIKLHSDGTLDRYKSRLVVLDNK